MTTNKLFFPGWGIPAHAYSRFISRHELLTINYGYFQSLPTYISIPESWPLDEMELMLLFRQFFTQKVILHGHSLGAIYAMKLAVLFPEKIEELHLYSPCNAFITHPPYPAHEKTGLLSMLENIQNKPQIVLKGFYQHLFSPNRPDFKPPEVSDLEALERDLLTLFEYDITPLIQTLKKLNIHVYYAKNDLVIPEKMSQDFINLLKIEKDHIHESERKGHAYLLNEKEI